MRPSMTARGSRMAIRYHNRVSPAVDVAEARVVTFTQRRRDALRPDVRRDRQADWRSLLRLATALHWVAAKGRPDMRPGACGVAALSEFRGRRLRAAPESRAYETMIEPPTDVPAGVKSLQSDTGSIDPGLPGHNWRSHSPFVRMLMTRKYRPHGVAMRFGPAPSTDWESKPRRTTHLWQP
jgi:hypothetical protein